ncbi:MAG: M14 family metallopeptidase [Bacteroidetes bacterium]|nr:M14 family metallopeptidase [Bacteroidota bacterium]MBS1634022.1 M14 family metallopeptidase [Bacteroidota bacterium]
MKKIFFLFTIALPVCVFSQTITTKYEQSGGKQSPTYFEIIEWWKKLDQLSNKVKMLTMGPSDAGFPLNLVMVSNDGDHNFQSIHKKNKKIIFVNNGIHPGEPDGIDASMLLVRDIVANKYKIPNDIVLALIPVYNIGGCLNRSPYYRIDQDGPEEKGFRGNSQNLDLNRDFIKSDSKEARSFAEIFHLLDPIVFFDNHVSDGADYQHVMTLLVSQHNKLGGEMGEFMNKEFEPGLYSLMKEKGYDLVPYVNAFGDTPETGWSAYWDSPRYSSGYATLWHCFGFVPESHMLKPYDQRVKGTYALMQCFISFTEKNGERMKQLKERTIQNEKNKTEFEISWKLDRSQHSTITYKGYEAGRKPSEVSGLPRLFYDRSKPFEKEVPFYNYYKASNTVQKPKAYIIPQGWWKVIDLLKINKVQMTPLKKDTVIEVQVYNIDNYKASPRQYEMHHINSDVKISTSFKKINFRKGDYYIPMNQEANRFLIETLEPQAEDSYFAWNFFDAILSQKEGFSGYSFEDIAAEYLNKHPDLKTRLEERKATDTSFAKNGYAQLNFVYQNSPYMEPAYLRYPVFRVIQ